MAPPGTFVHGGFFMEGNNMETAENPTPEEEAEPRYVLKTRDPETGKESRGNEGTRPELDDELGERIDAGEDAWIEPLV